MFLQQAVNGLIIGMGYVLLALGLTLIFGVLDVINFAQGELYMLGAYSVYVFGSVLGMPYIVASVLAVVAVALIGIVIERFSVRPLIRSDSLNTLLATFAVSILLSNTVQLVFTSTPRQVPTPFERMVRIGPILLTQQKLAVVVVGALLVLATQLVLRYTALGKLMRATAQNKFAAAICGIQVFRIYWITYGIGAGLAAAAGALLGPTAFAFPAMGANVVTKGFAIVILGGMGSVNGAVLGGLLLGITETLGAGFLSSAWKDMVGYTLLILVLLLRPAGLFATKGRGA